MFAYLNFRFKFINDQGNQTSILEQEGRVSEEGIMLGGETLMLEDVEKTARYSNKIVIVLKPYITISQELTEHILEGTHSIVIRTTGGAELAKDVKSTIDQKVSQISIKVREQELRNEGQHHEFRSAKCPNCYSEIDVSYYKPTPLTYCNYCDSIFESKGMPISGTEEHGICPECNYYGRIRSHQEVHFYAFPEGKIFRKKRYCCDTCAERITQPILKYNAPFLVGVPFNLWTLYRAGRGKNPSFPQLARANQLAQDGNIAKADQLYTLILLRNNMHPGFYYNHGLAHWQNGDEQGAAARFREALNLCSNYEPILEFLEIHASEQVG